MGDPAVCVKPEEVRQIFDDQIKPLTRCITRMEKQIGDLPCQALMERIIRLEIHRENADKLREADKKDIDILYSMSRTFETDIATLKEQNIGQDNMSSKTWVFILIGINFVFALAGYFLTRAPVPT